MDLKYTIMLNKNPGFLRKNNFKPGLKMNLFFIIFFSILVFLGLWQLDRGLDKNSTLGIYESKKQLIPLEGFYEGIKKEGLFYRNLVLQGRFLDKTFLLDNRVYRSKKGFEVLTPFITKTNKVFLINRGWLLEDLSDTLYEEKFSDDSIRIEGLLSPFKRLGLNLSKNTVFDSWPRVVQEITFLEVSRALNNLDLYEGIIQLSAASRYAFEPIWKPAEFKASRHFGYAVQWFGLAIVLLISFIIYGFKRNKDEDK